MSIEAMAWAFKQDTKGDAQLKLILLALCDHCDESGYCWPSQERLAKKAECSHDTVARKLSQLEDFGFLQRRRRARKTTIYRISLYKNAMMTQSLRDHDLAPTEAEKAEMLLDHDDANTSHDNAQLCVPNHQTLTTKKESIKEPHLFEDEESRQPTRQMKQEKQARRAQRQMMPEDWEPDEKGLGFAHDLGFTGNKIRQLVMACRDYHLKHGTMIAGSIGLSATWRTWCNNEVKFTAEREARYGQGHRRDQRTREEVIFAAVRGAASEMVGQRDRGWPDEAVHQPRHAEAHRRGAAPARIEDRRS